MVALTAASLLPSTTAEASGPTTLSRTPWQVIPIANYITGTPNYGSHGHISYYSHLPAYPSANHVNWSDCGPNSPIRTSPYAAPAPLCPDPATIGMVVGSRLPGCMTNVDFTLFQTFVDIPLGTTLTTFTVAMSGMDDGARITIFNSSYPSGLVVPGSYVYLGGSGTSNLAPYVVAGETNRVLITQMDDCAVGNNLQSAQVNLNGTVIPPTPPDTTPPVLTPVITGTLGNNGWYTSDVLLQWLVSEPESGEESVSLSVPGCYTQNIVNDTAGVTFTCTATSPGGSVTESVTIKRDATAPEATATRAPDANANGWNNTDVTVTFTGTDNLSGLASCDAPVVLGEGAGQSASGTCTDLAGNVSAPASVSDINVDKTAPEATATRAPDANANGWNNTDVTVTFTGTDGLSGIDSCEAPVVLGEGAGQSASGTCTDLAGNVSAPASVSDINVDKTAPVVTVTGVADGGTYTLGDVPAAGCDTADALSGVATAASASVSGGSVGTFTVTCDGAEDLAGNTAAATAVSYSVVYDFCGFKQPLLAPVQTFKKGSTVPVKFCLADASGAYVTTAVAQVYANGVFQGVAKWTGDHYHWNLRTNTLATGPLTISVTLDDGTTHSILVALR
ncbi:MAG: hypothetical protein AMXMBFR23_00610 [Chloroflexota bacterium]